MPSDDVLEAYAAHYRWVKAGNIVSESPYLPKIMEYVDSIDVWERLSEY